MSGLIAELKYQFRYRLPMWLVQLLTNWLPENRVTIRIRVLFWQLVITQQIGSYDNKLFS